MKYVQTIWQTDPAQTAAQQECWMGNLIAEMGTDFPISCSFVVLPEHCKRVSVWLGAKAVGPYTVELMPDGRIAVALGDRNDAVRLREHHRHCLDRDVIVANRSAEQVNGFIRQMKSGLAS